MAAISLSAVLSAGASARLASAAVLLQIVASTPSAQAQVGPTFNLLYSFTNITAGEFPQAGLVRDAAGNLYGTSYYGGDIHIPGIHVFQGEISLETKIGARVEDTFHMTDAASAVVSKPTLLRRVARWLRSLL